MYLTRKTLPQLAAIAFTCSLSCVAHAADDYQAQTLQWQQQRLEHFRQPDSWLSVTGSDVLHKGVNTVGSGADQDIVLPDGPAHLGTVTLAGDGTLHTAFSDDGKVTVDHAPSGPGSIEPAHVKGVYFQPDGTLALDPAKVAHPLPPTVVHIGSTTLQFYSHEAPGDDGKKTLIVMDPNAPARTHFKGLDYFPVDASWKISARWELLKKPIVVEVAYVQGSVKKVTIRGKVEFDRDGQHYQLLPYLQGSDGELLFVFADRTSGKETYGGARFLITSAPKDGKVTLDFNQAVNPPCALIPFPNCPIAIPQNRLPVRVAAGEKKVNEAA